MTISAHGWACARLCRSHRFCHSAPRGISISASNPTRSLVEQNTPLTKPTRRRGGANLTDRFSTPPHLSQTESSFVDAEISHLSPAGQAFPGSHDAASRLARESEEYTLVGGVRVPKEPRPPADDECCMSGCAVCVYDLYMEAKAAYAQSLRASLDALKERKVPKSLWPEAVLSLSDRQDKEGHDASISFEEEGPMDAAMKAFIELEKRLKGGGP